MSSTDSTTVGIFSEIGGNFFVDTAMEMGESPTQAIRVLAKTLFEMEAACFNGRTAEQTLPRDVATSLYMRFDQISEPEVYYTGHTFKIIYLPSNKAEMHFHVEGLLNDFLEGKELCLLDVDARVEAKTQVLNGKANFPVIPGFYRLEIGMD